MLFLLSLSVVLLAPTASSMGLATPLAPFEFPWTMTLTKITARITSGQTATGYLAALQGACLVSYAALTMTVMRLIPTRPSAQLWVISGIPAIMRSAPLPVAAMTAMNSTIPVGYGPMPPGPTILQIMLAAAHLPTASSMANAFHLASRLALPQGPSQISISAGWDNGGEGTPKQISAMSFQAHNDGASAARSILQRAAEMTLWQVFWSRAKRPGLQEWIRPSEPILQILPVAT